MPTIPWDEYEGEYRLLLQPPAASPPTPGGPIPILPPPPDPWLPLFQWQPISSSGTYLIDTTLVPDGTYQMQVRGRRSLTTGGWLVGPFGTPSSFIVDHRIVGAGANYVTLEEAASIAEFGRRFMQLVEEASSNIDTLAEATRMGQAALDDLAFPPVDHDVETLYFWPVELGDRYTFQPNDVHHDTDQTSYVTGYSLVFENGSGRATFRTRATPSGGYLTWLRRQG